MAAAQTLQWAVATDYGRGGLDCASTQLEPMTDNQSIEIPPSFTALFTTPGRIKPNLTLVAMSARYELCEDLATMLTEHAKTVLFDLGITETDVLERCELGLLTEASAVSQVEARWVIRRLAELLGWDDPGEALPT